MSTCRNRKKGRKQKAGYAFEIGKTPHIRLESALFGPYLDHIVDQV